MNLHLKEIAYLTLNQFVEQLFPYRKEQNGIRSSMAKGNFFIFKLEDLTGSINQFSTPFMPDFFSVYFIQHGQFEKINQLDKMVLRHGEIYFSKPGEVKTWRFANQTKGFLALFTKDYLLTLIDNKNILNTFEYLLPNAREKFELDPARRQFFSHVFGEIYQEVQNPGRHSQELIKLWLFVLLFKTNRIYANSAISNGHGQFKNSGDFIYNKFLLALEENFARLNRGDCAKPYSVREFAEHLNINPSYLNECIKKACGRTAKALISERWLLLAKCQLLHTGKNISEIAYNLGFESPGYFARFFKKFEGITPLGFRKVSAA